MSEFSPRMLSIMTQKLLKYLKITGYVLLTLLIILLVGGGIFSYNYKDKIIAYFVERANERLIVPVDIGKIDVSVFQQFPATSIVLEQITIKSTDEFKTEYLAKVPKAYLTLNPFKVMRGKYEIDEFIVEGGEVNLEINAVGNANYQIVKKRGEQAGPVESTIKILANGVHLNYIDQRSNKDFGFLLEKVKSTVAIFRRNYKANIDGDVLVSHISLDELTYFKDKEVEVATFLNIDDEMRFLTIEKGDLKIGKGDFTVIGDVSYNSPMKVDLAITGIKTNTQTVISLLPDAYANPIKSYRSKGEVYFNGTVKGEFTENYYPNTILHFGASDASFFHPDYKKELKNIALAGKLETGIRKDFSGAYLQLIDVKLELDEYPIAGRLEIKDFKEPWINSELKGTFSLDAMVQVFPDSKIESAYGKMRTDIRFKGFPKSASGIKAFNADGEVELQNVSFILKGERLPFNKFNGSFIFRENDLAISDFSGMVGKSDFLVNGFFKNITSFFKKAHNKVKIEADLKSNYLDFDELLKTNFASQDTLNTGGHKYNFNISPDIDLNFNCDIKKLRFKRFYSSAITGNLRVLNQIATLNELGLNTMGGRLRVDASVNNKLSSVVEISCDANLSGIYIDSVFYVFHNFDQTWLVDKNLRGQLNSDVSTYILLDNHLRFYSNDFSATIGASIKNGELLNFEPMQKLSRFVEEESLAHLKFSEVRNEIIIKNKTIYIPRMLVSSSVTNIQVSGTHHFDQRIDYHVAVPLRSFLRLRKLTDREIEERSDGSHLLLRIFGTTSDYQIKYDKQELKQKIADDIKKEGKELKEVFQNKGKTEQDVIIVEDDDYFDFDEDQ